MIDPSISSLCDHYFRISDILAAPYKVLTQEGSIIALTLDPALAGSFPEVTPLVYLGISTRLSTLGALVFYGTKLDQVFVFPVIDHVPMYFDSNKEAFVPLADTVSPDDYPSLAFPANSDFSPLMAFFDGTKSHELSFALFFATDGLVAPTVAKISEVHAYIPDNEAASLTTVTGFYMGQAPQSFKVKLNIPSVVWNGSAILSSTYTVPVGSDGSWSVSLPNTDDMDSTFAGYLFYLDPASPLSRRVPKVSSIRFGDLPISRRPR